MFRQIDDKEIKISFADIELFLDSAFVTCQLGTFSSKFEICQKPALAKLNAMMVLPLSKTLIETVKVAILPTTASKLFQYGLRV